MEMLTLPLILIYRYAAFLAGLKNFFMSTCLQSTMLVFILGISKCTEHIAALFILLLSPPAPFPLSLNLLPTCKSSISPFPTNFYFVF